MKPNISAAMKHNAPKSQALLTPDQCLKHAEHLCARLRKEA